jgi:hypothetical protein
MLNTISSCYVLLLQMMIIMGVIAVILLAIIIGKSENNMCFHNCKPLDTVGYSPHSHKPPEAEHALEMFQPATQILYMSVSQPLANGCT